MQFNSQAQQILTRGEVFDFQPGDVFYTEFWGYCGCLTIYNEYEEIMQRDSSANGDTLYYTIRRVHGLPSAPAIFWDTIVMQYFNLDQPFMLMTDSIIISENYFVDSCGFERWERTSFTPPGQFVIHDTCYSYAIKGCGGYYYDHNELTTSMGCWMHRFLLYYKKGAIECGTLPTGIQETEMRDESIQLYPNPTTGKIFWNSTEIFDSYELWSEDGSLVECNTIHGSSISLNPTAPGCYVLILTDQNGIPHRKPLIITGE